jgi:hypothetical protein
MVSSSRLRLGPLKGGSGAVNGVVNVVSEAAWSLGDEGVSTVASQLLNEEKLIVARVIKETPQRMWYVDADLEGALGFVPGAIVMLPTSY